MSSTICEFVNAHLCCRVILILLVVCAAFFVCSFERWTAVVASCFILLTCVLCVHLNIWRFQNVFRHSECCCCCTQSVPFEFEAETIVFV